MLVSVNNFIYFLVMCDNEFILFISCSLPPLKHVWVLKWKYLIWKYVTFNILVK